MRSIAAIVYFYGDMTRIVTVSTDVRACAQIAVQPAWAAGKYQFMCEIEPLT